MEYRIGPTEKESFDARSLPKGLTTFLRGVASVRKSESGYLGVGRFPKPPRVRLRKIVTFLRALFPGRADWSCGR